jgi:hypothetical protein
MPHGRLTGESRNLRWVLSHTVSKHSLRAHLFILSIALVPPLFPGKADPTLS